MPKNALIASWMFFDDRSKNTMVVPNCISFTKNETSHLNAIVNFYVFVLETLNFKPTALLVPSHAVQFRDTVSDSVSSENGENAEAESPRIFRAIFQKTSPSRPSTALAQDPRRTLFVCLNVKFGIKKRSKHLFRLIYQF